MKTEHKYIETTLTWEDVYIVMAGGRLTTWSGRTVPLIICDVSVDDIPMWNGKSKSKPRIYLLRSKEHHDEATMDLGGVYCLSFYTEAIEKLLKQ